MEKIKRRFSLSGSGQEGWFLGAVISLVFLPDFLKATMMMLKGDGLSDVQIVICSICSFLLAAACMFFATGIPALIPFLGCGLWILFADILADFVMNRSFITNYHWKTLGETTFWVPELITFLIQGAWIGACLMLLMFAKTRIRKEKLCAKNIPTIAFFTGSYTVARMFCAVLTNKYLYGYGKNESVTVYLTKLFLFAAIAAVIMLPSFCYMMRKAEGSALESAKKAANTENGEKVSFKPAGIAGYVLPLVGFLFVIILTKVTAPSAVDQVLDGFISYISQAEFREIYEDYAGVQVELQNMEAVMEAWKAYTAEDYEELTEIAQLNPSEEQVQLLYVYALMENGGKKDSEKILQTINANLLRHPDEAVWNFLYLKFASLKDQTVSGRSKADEKAFRRKIVEKLAAAGVFANETFDPGTLTQKEKEKIQDSLTDELIEDAHVAFAVSEMKYELLEAAGDYEKVLDSFLEKAEKYPEHYGVQEMAIKAVQQVYYHRRWTKSYDDQARLKEKIPPLVERFERARQTAADKITGLTEEEKENVMIDGAYEIAEILYDCNLMEELQEYLTNALKDLDSTLLSDFLMIAAMYNEDYDTVMPILEKNLQESPDSAMYTSLMAVASYRKGDLEKSLEYAVKLSELAIEENADPKAGAEVMALVDIYVVSDHAISREDSYINYRDVILPQYGELLQKSKTLGTLMECERIYRGYVTSGHDKISETIQELEKMIEQYPDFSAPYYILANLYGVYKLGLFEEEYKDLIDFDRAEELYRKCLEIDEDQPVVWFALANLYDHLEEYEASYTCAGHAAALMIEGAYGEAYVSKFHGYGTLDHALDLIRDLKRELKIYD